MSTTDARCANYHDKDVAETRRFEGNIARAQDSSLRSGKAVLLLHNTRTGDVPASYVHEISRYGIAAVESLRRSHLTLIFNGPDGAGQAMNAFIKNVAADPMADAIVMVTVSDRSSQ